MADDRINDLHRRLCDFLDTIGELATDRAAIAINVCNDLEPDPDAEPPLGWTTAIGQNGRDWLGAADPGEAEPSLGYVLPGGIVDTEGPDDNGVGDEGGVREQFGRAS